MKVHDIAAVHGCSVPISVLTSNRHRNGFHRIRNSHQSGYRHQHLFLDKWMAFGDFCVSDQRSFRRLNASSGKDFRRIFADPIFIGVAIL